MQVRCGGVQTVATQTVKSKLGGPGGIRTHGGIFPADYESAACNQHGVRPCSEARDLTLKFAQSPLPRLDL
ncbi:protein of unknown function (plasmid) [Cupriavidus taiwanensis]|nr:protein of unknown function [Cupriavidus taiwanensis]